MSARLKATNAEIIAAYKTTGSVWAAAKQLGMGGQSVHERLRALDYPLAGQKWTSEELDELRTLVGHMTVGQVAHRLGRPYAGVACKISELGIGERFGNRVKVKIPRAAGYDKVSVAKYIKAIDAARVPMTAFAKRNALGVEALVNAIERHFPDWWQSYRATHSDLPEAECPYCHRTFIPSTKKQGFCSRKCAADQRTDVAYFGGKRRSTIGLAEGKCQLCGKEGSKGLSSHHVYGKANDPENEVLIALCTGCHQIVGALAGRTFLEHAEGWESLIQLAHLRRMGAQRLPGVYASVEIEALTDVDDQYPH